LPIDRARSQAVSLAAAPQPVFAGCLGGCTVGRCSAIWRRV